MNKQRYLAEELANFIVDTSWKDLTKDSIQNAKKVLLDALGVALAGSSAPCSKLVLDCISEMGGRGESTIIGTKIKVPAPSAALVNGTMVHSYDFDDVHSASQTHAGSVVIPTVLACGEKRGVDGKKLIEAIVLGYEVMYRVGEALNAIPGAHYKRGFHPTSTCGTFAAVASASKIFDLDSEKIANAFGIAGSYAAGLMEFLADGSMTKRFHPGRAAQCGILSCLLASKGFTGPRSVFEGRDGFLRAYSDEVDASKLTAGLGEKFKISETRLKPYACCASIHSSLDALLSIIREYNINYEGLIRVDVGITSVAYNLVASPMELKYEPKTVLSAQLSLPYCLAAVSIYGKLGLGEVSEVSLKDMKIIELARRIKVYIDPELDKARKQDPNISPAIVKVTTEAGKTYVKRVDNPKGSPQNPMSLEEVKDKAYECSRFGVKWEVNIRNLLELVSKLDEVGNIRSLVELLSW